MHPTPPEASQNTFGLLAMVLGIASIPLIFVFTLGLPFGVAAIVFGVLGLRSYRQGSADNRGQSITGIVCGAIGAGSLIILIII
jgi:hypothetical protein